MRKYSIDEIDRMRSILIKTRTVQFYDDGSYFETWLKENDHQIIEEHLRTYMIAGIKPKALEKKWKEFLDKAHKIDCHEFDDAI